MDELVTFDEFRILKDQLNENKEKEEKIITEDIIADSSDSEKEDEENYGETAKTEALGNILLISLLDLNFGPEGFLDQHMDPNLKLKKNGPN